MKRSMVLWSSNKSQSVLLLLFMLLIQFSGIAQKVTTGSEYVWSTPGTWSPSGAPASTYNNTVTVNANHPLTLDQGLTIASGSGDYIFNADVTDQPGGTDYNLVATTNNGRLEVKSGTTTFEGNANRLTGSVIIVRSGATLILGKPGTVNSNSNLTDLNGEWTLKIGNGTSITIEGTLIVYGDILNSNSTGGASFSIASTGLVQVYGSYKTDNGNIDITGTGNFFTSGKMLTQGSGDIFGTPNDCTTGPCSGQTLTCGASSSAYTASVTPISQTVCSGTAGGTLTFTTNIPATTTYRWQSSSSINGTYSYITASATLPSPSPTATVTLSPGNISATTWYRVEYTNSSSGCGTKYSSPVPIYITGALVAQSTAGQTQCAGGSFGPISVTASGTGLSYQWYSNASNSNSGGTLISGATSSVYTPQPTSTSAPTYYYCVISASGCSTPVTSAVSGAFTVTTNAWTGGSSTAWSDTGNWSCGKIPTSLIDLTLANGLPRYPVIAAGQTVLINNLTIASAASISLATTTASLEVYGNFANSGTFTHNNGTLSLKGNSNQTFGSASDLYNLTIDKTGGNVTLNATTSIVSSLKFISATTLNTGGFLVIKSTGNTTDKDGRIETLPTGAAISGDIKVERYMDALASFRYIASPVVSSSFPTQLSNLYQYTNTAGSGAWTKYSSGKTLAKGEGYTTLMGASQVTWSATGAAHTGDHSWTLGTGWNLLGNPYASSIEWKLAGWSVTGGTISSIMAITDNAVASYPAYFRFYDYNNTNATSATIGWGTGPVQNGVISMGQSFWVYANGPCTLTVSESAKVNPTTKTGKFYREGDQQNQSATFAISLGNKVVGDQSYLLINDKKQPEQFDFTKLFNQEVNIYFIDDTQRNMLTYSLGALADHTKIPVGLQVGEPGEYQISFAHVEALGRPVYLVDKHLGVVVPISSTTSYSVTINEATKTQHDRFYISTSPKMERPDSFVSVYPNPVNDQLTVQVKGVKGNSSVSLMDVKGNIVTSSGLKGEGTIDMSSLTNGLYILKVQTEQGVHIEKVIKQ